MHLLGVRLGYTAGWRGGSVRDESAAAEDGDGRKSGLRPPGPLALLSGLRLQAPAEHLPEEGSLREARGDQVG